MITALNSSEMLPIAKNWHKNICIVGGILLGRESDLDIFVYGKMLQKSPQLENEVFYNGLK